MSASSKSMRAEYLGPARRRGPVLDAALAIVADGGFEGAFMAGRLAGSDRLKVPESVAELYVRGVVAVAEELARWTLRRPDLDRRAMVQLVVLWFMQGFDRLVPAVEG